MSDDNATLLRAESGSPPHASMNGLRSRRTTLEKLLFVSTIVLLIAVVALTVALANAPHKSENEQDLPQTAPVEPPVTPIPDIDTWMGKALQLQRQFPLIDGHNDLPWEIRMQVNNSLRAFNLGVIQPSVETDIPRLRLGEVGGQFWSVFVPCDTKWIDAVRMTMEQIDLVKRMTEWYPDTFQYCSTSQCLVEAFKAGKIGSVAGMEGGHSIDSSLGALRSFYNLGARYMTLTHTCNTPWAQSCVPSEPAVGGTAGITAWGRRVVQEMNRMGMLVDLSHVSHNTMRTVLLNVAAAPVIFSHSSAYAICDNPRNVPDDVLRMLPQNGGVVMVNFFVNFLNCSANPTATVDTIVDHINHIRDVAGISHIGLGSDFDGVGGKLPVNMTDVSFYPHLTARLLEVGYSEEDVAKIIGGNVLRVFQQAEDVSARLRVQGQSDNEWLYGYNFTGEGDKCRSAF